MDTPPLPITPENPPNNNHNSQTKYTSRIFLAVFAFIVAAAISSYLSLNRTSSLQKNTSQINSPPVITSPTPAPTFSWQTYTNLKYGYSLKYQKDPSVVQVLCQDLPDKYNSGEVFVLKKATDPNLSSCLDMTGNAYFITIILVSSGNQSTRQDILNAYPAKEWDTTITPISIDTKIPAYLTNAHYKLDDPSGWSVPDRNEVRFYYNKNTYIIHLGDPDYKKYFDEIIASLKFPECFSDPEKALDSFLNYLSTAQYDRAADLYDDHLSSSNSSTSATINRFCEGYATCLPHKIISQTKSDADTFLFEVIFYENGKPFTLPKPVIPDTTPEPTLINGTPIKFVVKKTNGCYKNFDLPPVTP